MEEKTIHLKFGRIFPNGFHRTRMLKFSVKKTAGNSGPKLVQEN